MPCFTSAVAATAAECAAVLPGDELVAPADVVMDRAFSVHASPDDVWPWLVQLGKARAGWYLPRRVECLVPRSRRALRAIDPQWQRLRVGDVIPDYGGSDATFQVAILRPPRALVYTSTRGRTRMSWAIVVSEKSGRLGPMASSRVQLRLRLAPVRRRWLARTVGDAFDALTIAGMAAGLRERLSG